MRNGWAGWSGARVVVVVVGVVVAAAAAVAIVRQGILYQTSFMVP